MANEITVGASLACTKDGTTESLITNGQITQAGHVIQRQKVSVGTVAQALSIGSITGVPVCVYLKNLDLTNYVEVDSVNTFTNFPQKLRPNIPIVLAPETATIYLKANTAACLVDTFCVES